MTALAVNVALPRTSDDTEYCGVPLSVALPLISEAHEKLISAVSLPIPLRLAVRLKFPIFGAASLEAIKAIVI